MIWKSKRNRDRNRRGSADAVKRRSRGPERLETRRLLAADPVHVGVVYLETDYLETDQDVGSDSRGDRFILSFTGGAPDTQLSELRIRTDKDGDGITVGDPIFDTMQGGRGKKGAHGFQIVDVQTADGRQVDATAEVEDGGQELILRLSNFRAGDRLEFTVDVDEVLRDAIDLAVFNDRLDVITSGQEFQDSILEATFNAPHYETTQADAIFLNDYGDPSQASGLDLPPDEGSDVDSRPNRSAAAVASAVQVPKPIEIAGHVWIDNDLDAVRQSGEQLLAGVEIALWKQTDDGSYIDTQQRATTDSAGRYVFSKSLGLLPGQYRVVESQPEGLYSVAAVPGTVSGIETGLVESPDALTSINLPLGDTSAINYDFAEAQPASLSGFVYQDNDNDGERDALEQGIAGVRVRLVPINTIAPQAVLTVVSSGDGSYSFTGLAPGSYEVIEVDQPSNLNDGIDAAGTINGQVVGVAQNPGDRISQVLLAGSDAGVEYNFGEVPFGSIAGHVYLAAPGQDCSGDHDAAGSTPLGGVQVTLQTDSGVTVARTTTGADGGYTFNDIPVGNYRIIEFTPSGLIDGSSHVGRMDNLQVGSSIDGGLIQDITMTPAGVGVEYNFCEAAPASVSGYVYSDQSNDGIRDTNESSIAGVRVSLIDASGRVVATDDTDANGRYQFLGIEPGEYSIFESQPPGFLDGIDSVGSIRGQSAGRASANDTLAVSLKQGDVGENYNFGELLSASLQGRVHVDIDDDCILDEDEETLSGVIIRLLNATGDEVARTTTDSQGQYSFQNLAPGQYTVIEEQPAGFFEGNANAGSAGGIVNSGSRIGNITLASGETAVNYNFCERPPAEIAGSVFSDRNGDCFFQVDETGIEGVRVELYDDSGNLVATAMTDASGNYRFTNLAAGSYTVREIQPALWLQGGQRAGSAGGNDLMADVISQIPVGWGERLTQYNFCELEPSSISGIVFVDSNSDSVQDADEPLLEGVTIELRVGGGRFVARTTTDANGRYSFDSLSSGRYEIFEQQPDGFFHGGQIAGTGDGEVLGDDRLGVNLQAGEQLVDYNFYETLPSSISGKVWQESDPNQRFEPGDVPVPGVLVQLIDDSGDTVAQTRTDPAGNYTFTSLAPGVYSVRESQPAGLFHGGQVVGDVGGRVGGDDLLVGITLLGGTHASRYDFPEVPPALLSGFVFQDGETINLQEIPEPERLRDYRDGILTADDQRLGGVTLELRNVLGLPFDSSRALPGVYQDGPIRVTTDASGYYEFRGLRPGTYHVYEVQPANYIDGLDTPGSTGGVAVNAADRIEDDDRIMIQTLAFSERTDPHDDAILNIMLVGGGESVNNNFSEVIIAVPPVFRIDPPQAETPAKVTAPIETFDPRTRLVTFAVPQTYQNNFYGSDEWAVSWHLSVINGGFPRGTVNEDGTIRSVSARGIRESWIDGDHARGKWSITMRRGPELNSSGKITLGDENATALTGDFDGDGSDEAAIFVGGEWFVDLNGNGLWDSGDLWIKLGTELDRPVVGDWDGDGKDDIGIFGRQWQRDPQRIKRDPGLPDPDNKRRRHVDSRHLAVHGENRGEDRQRWLRRGTQGSLRADAVDHVFQYGEQVDTPIAGDWNGDGIDQIAVFRSGQWLLDVDGDGRWTRSDARADYGRAGDQPIVGDFNGDEIDEIGIVRGDVWIIDTDGDRRITGNDLRIVVPRESADSQPIVGDFDGDGIDDPGYYDEAA